MSLTLIEVATVDHSYVGGVESADLVEASEYIRAELEKSTVAKMRIGQRLAVAKAGCWQGSWERWVEECCGISRRCAQAYMRIADVYGSEDTKAPSYLALSYLTEEAALALAAKRVPGDVRARVIKKIVDEEKRVGLDKVRETLSRRGVPQPQGGGGGHRRPTANDQPDADDPEAIGLAEEYVDVINDETVERLGPLLDAGEAAWLAFRVHLMERRR